MKNLKYAYLSISKKPFLNIIIMIQVIVASMIVYSTLEVSNEIIQNSDRILNIFNDKKAYYMKVSYDFLDRLDNKKFTCDDVIKAYQLLKNNRQFIHFYCDNGFIYVKPFSGVEKFRNNPSSETVGNTKYLPVNLMTIDKEMNNQFKLKFIEGKGFDREDFENEKDISPIILGYDYKDKYKVGDMFEYYDGTNKSVRQAKVIGILQQDSYLLYKVDYANKFTNLNNYVITSFMDLDKVNRDNFLDTGKYYNQVFALFNTSYFLFDKSKSDTEIKKIVDEVNKNFEKLNIGSQDIENVDNYLEIDKEMLRDQKHTSIIMSVIIIIFLSLGIVTSLLYSIKKDRMVYGIHILNGATLNDISIRLLEQMLLIFFTGFIVSISFIHMMFKTLNLILLLEIVVLLIILSLLTCIIPMLKVKKLNVTDLIKGGD